MANIMAVAAHPGDGMFTMGAAVAKQVHDGGHGVFVSMSLGEKGHPRIPGREYGEMQRKAMQDAAKLLGAEALFLPYGDAEVPANQDAAFSVCDIIREHKPDIMITHWHGSWHKDHQNTYLVVRDAVFYAGLAAMSRSNPAHAVRKLFFAENWEDETGFQADTYLNVTSVFDNWVKACALFPMWRGETGFRYNDYYQSLAVMRGARSGFERAAALMSDPDQRMSRLQSLS
jgi:LmbE family N-acetylglucosaminyl deacetylase